MALIEQAIYTLVRSDSSDPGQKNHKPNRYGVVAASSGVDLADVEAIADWSPRAEDMLDQSSTGVSFNFHPLPSGAFCISRSTMHGWEYGDSSPHFAYTQCLIVPTSELFSFANDPFAVLRAAVAGGILDIQHHVSGQLEPLRLSGESPPVDATLLNRLRDIPGSEWLAAAVQAALDSQRLVLYQTEETKHLLAGILQCIPVECRPEFSFTTGLRDDPNRPFRVIVGEKHNGNIPTTSSQVESPDTEIPMHWRIAELDLAAQRPPQEFAPLDGWPHLIDVVLKSNRLGFLSTQLAKRRFGLSTEDLPALALQLMENLDSSTMIFESNESPAPEPKKAPDAPSDWFDGLQRAHAAHRFFQGSAALTLAPTSNESTTSPISSDDPIVQEKIEQLDELVCEVIGGNLQLLPELRTVWDKLRKELGTKIIDTCREHYLRHALQFWQQASETGEPIRDTKHAMLALDVLCLLFDRS